MEPFGPLFESFRRPVMNTSAAEKTDIRVSIVIPAYNAADFIGETLDSLRQQTFQAFEIIAGKESAKVRHVAETGRAALCIDKRGPGAMHVTAEGPCELGDTATREWRLKLHTHYRGADAAEKVVANDGHLAQRFMLLRPERWYGWSSE